MQGRITFMSFDMNIDPINTLRILMLGAKGPEMLPLHGYSKFNIY